MISRVKLERLQRELSQSELSERIGIPQWRISLIERGIKPGADEARKFAEVFGVEARELFVGVEE